MYKLIYTYTHPTDILSAIQFSPDLVTFRANFLSFAHENGLITTETRQVDEFTVVHEAIWNSKAEWETAKQMAGYADFVQAIQSHLAATGASYNLVEMEV